jgi:hypothetical protein
LGESNRRQELYSLPRRFGLLVGLCASPIFIVFVYLGDPERGFTAWFSAAMVLATVGLFWGLRKRGWFWITITIITLLHVLLIFFVPWPFKHHLSYVALLPIGLLDFAIAYGIIRLVEKAIGNES